MMYTFPNFSRESTGEDTTVCLAKHNVGQNLGKAWKVFGNLWDTLITYLETSTTVKSSFKILLLPEQKISLLKKVGRFLIITELGFDILPFSILFLQFQKIF